MRKYSKEVVEEAVLKSFSISGVIRFLGIEINGHNHRTFTRYIEEYNLDTSHFRHGFTGTISAQKKPPSEILVVRKDKSLRESGTKLRRALVESGVEERCADCGIEKIWNDKPIVLEIDHIDGDFSNCLITNLRFVCPNCHSQAPTSKRQKKLIAVTCQCGKEFLTSARKELRHKHCSKQCRGKYRVAKVAWPSDSELSSLLETKSLTQISEVLECSRAAVGRYCRKHNLTKMLDLSTRT